MTTLDYTAHNLRTDNGDLLELVPEFGGLTNRLRFVSAQGPIDVIVGLPNRQAMVEDIVYRGIPIFPVVNRVEDGRYRFADVPYQLPINEPSRNNALHGLLHHLQPKVELAEGGNEATLTYSYKGDEKGYPFPVDVAIHYRLNADSSLDIEYRIHNRHHSAIPVGIGWHPYFGFSHPVDDCLLKLPPVKRLGIDSRLLPTGEKLPYDAFAKPSSLRGVELDDCFALIPDEREETASILLWSEKHQLGVEIWQQTGDRAFNFIQVCTAADRQSVAIEPVSCGINAFNTGDGLITLPADDSFTARMGVRLVTSL
jgi:aldose 1-epimerase